MAPSSRSKPLKRRPGSAALRRTFRYLGHYRRQALMPYIFLIIATLSQLAVPRMVGNIIDAVTQGVLAQNVLAALGKIPAAILPQALPRILEAFKFPSGWTVEQLQNALNLQRSSTPRALLTASLAIIVFAALRG